MTQGPEAHKPTQPAGLLEISLAKTAHGAFLAARSLFDLIRCTEAEQQIGKSEARRILHPFFLRATFAQIHLVHFAFKNLGQEHCRIIAFANVAQHFC